MEIKITVRDIDLQFFTFKKSGKVHDPCDERITKGITVL